MGRSVTGIMAQNIAGNMMSGATICGYYGNATEELCTRWYMLASF